MEFKPVREIDWKPLLETDEDVIVVVAPIVTKELRNHKNGKDPRKSARARTAMQELAALRKTKQVEGRPGVTIGFCGNPSRALMEEHLLEWDQGDDQLLGSMLKERTRTTDRIVLIADDSNLLQHAEQLRFEAVEPPDKYERRPESDPRDAKIKKLEEAVRQHEDKHAKLSLTFPDGSQELQSPPLRLVDATKLAVEYTQEMIHARQQVNEMEPWGSFREQQGALRSGREQHRGLDLSEWMHKWQEAAQLQAREEALIARTFRAELWLANDGLEEAESVRVYLTIPEGVEAVNKPTRFQQFPEYPNWRHNKGDIWQQFAERMPIFRARPMEDWPSPDWASGLGVSVPTPHEGGREQLYYVGQVPYDYKAPFACIGLTFETESVPREAIQLPYRITALGTPEREGRLLVRLSVPM